MTQKCKYGYIKIGIEKLAADHKTGEVVINDSSLFPPNYHLTYVD